MTMTCYGTVSRLRPVLALLLAYFPFGAAAQTAPVVTTAAARTTAGPITRPMVVEIAKDTYFINEFGMDAQYLVAGEKRALVIDTGTGFYDMKELIGRLTSLPYDVVVTHGHPDHAGGVGQFDTVYMHPADVGAAKRLTYEGAVQYGEIMWNMAIGYRGVWGYTPADARRFTKLPEFKPLGEGTVFDLGGRKLTVYEVPGHTLGSVVLIDDKSRILFSGDAANGNVGANATSVSTLLRGLIKLRNLRSAYDRQYTGHTSYAGTIDAVSQSPQVLDDLIEAFRSLLRGNAKTQVIKNHLFPERTQTVAVYGRASVGFNPDRLWEPGEEHIVP
jgi:glyoxylase-like metal-dependent hydrolase (beta-lactamase superfamily II)